MFIIIDSRTLVLLPYFLASTRYSAADNDFTWRRGHVALLPTARDVVACRSAPDQGSGRGDRGDGATSHAV
eukprot:1971600-Pleurochrysis_carterae.AAC.2